MPKHGSWLNIAEIELSALTRQCLNRRIPTIDVLKTKKQVPGTGNATNPGRVFTTEDARIKLKRLYPVILQD